MKNAMKAILQKDLRGVTGNRRLFAALLVVPLVFAVVLPTVFLLTFALGAGQGDLEPLLALLPEGAGDPAGALAGLFLDSILPAFFLVIPVMAASVTAAGAFVGEKEKRTLETLLYCPLTLSQVFRAKVLASFLLSMAVTVGSFALMAGTVALESVLLLGELRLPGPVWLAVLLLLAPAVSLIAVTMIVRVSAKAQTVEESQQSAVFLVIPIVALAAGQVSGLGVVSPLILVALGAALAVLAGFLLRRALGRFTYEELFR